MTSTARSRAAPRLSVNKLGQYVRARTSSRRKQIVTDQKHPPDFKTLWYREARLLARDFVVGGCAVRDNLIESARELASAVGGSQQAKASRLQSEAMDALLACADDIDLTGIVVVAGPDRAEKLMINGIEVSVQPDVILRDTSTNRVGVMKFHFAKTVDVQLDYDSGLDVALVLRMYVEQNMPDVVCEPSLCQVVDVFASEIYVAPSATTKRRRQIEAAMGEFALWWSAV